MFADSPKAPMLTHPVVERSKRKGKVTKFRLIGEGVQISVGFLGMLVIVIVGGGGGGGDKNADFSHKQRLKQCESSSSYT